MDKKSKLLTIGQFAALHGINKKTLMWYDEIGLFKPASVNPENGYRYYNYLQSPILETILLLRELDVSINEIQRFMKNRSAENLKLLLYEKIARLDLQILHLQAVRKTLCNYHQNMETLLTMDLSEISIVEKEERLLVTVDIDKNTSFEKEVELITAQTTLYQVGHL
ncbi:MAG: MerR family transcriptional regulator, partial [Lachnospiraceae bacterium]|nr:MerR family transcriptional regulator [Lachnospiraceae bacterium]